MRASRSWPRSSVPNGCCHDGALSRAVKSISLIEAPQNSGAKRIAAIIAKRMNPLANASRWRRNRRHASRHGEKCRAGRGAARSAERDARIEPSIEDVRDEIEQDDKAGEHESDRHDH